MQVVFDKIPIELLVVASVHTRDKQSYRRRLPIYTITQNRQKVDNCVWCQSPKLRRRQIFYKKTYLALYLETPKISPPKVEKPTHRTELYHHANFQADQREISDVPEQKNNISL